MSNECTIGLDVGFGWTKVCLRENGELKRCFKFPSWIAYHSKSAISDMHVVVYDGKEYVVGEDARIENKKVIINDIGDLINYYPVFAKHAINQLNVSSECKIVTGLPPIYKNFSDNIKSMGMEVVPQGVGIWLDVRDKIKTGEAVVLDIGFNTVDYIIVIDDVKKKGSTITKLGVERLVEFFRDKLPVDLQYLKQLPFQRLMTTFEKGMTTIDGEEIDLSGYKKQATEEYNEMLITRLKNEVGSIMDEISSIVIAGGGAYYIKPFRKSGVFIPEEPEMSQARGYTKVVE
ncbi:MAG TPA: ParM/StbA family protein [Thermodesulfobium narugense]|nr:ParM/StbA family protein [Thermodesulfobium narugense]